MSSTDSPTRGALWVCPRCKRGFANRNQVHTCGLQELEMHFAGTQSVVREIFAAFDSAIRTHCGPVTVLPEKTRIAFQVRMSFAVLMPRKSYMNGHLVLDSRASHPCFLKVETYSPRNHVHRFRLHAPADLDEDFIHLLRAAYAVGEQKHLSR